MLVNIKYLHFHLEINALIHQLLLKLPLLLSFQNHNDNEDNYSMFLLLEDNYSDESTSKSILVNAPLDAMSEACEELKLIAKPEFLNKCI